MTFIKCCKFNISLLAVLCCTCPAMAVYQAAWDNPNANMAAGSLKPGYANLTWSTGTVLPIKTRAGMATLVTLPNGEKIADIVTGNEALFQIDANPGDQSMYITPTDENNGNDDEDIKKENVKDNKSDNNNNNKNNEKKEEEENQKPENKSDENNNNNNDYQILIDYLETKLKEKTKTFSQNHIVGNFL